MLRTVPWAAMPAAVVRLAPAMIGLAHDGPYQEWPESRLRQGDDQARNADGTPKSAFAADRDGCPFVRDRMLQRFVRPRGGS
jgi:hypothetical protein